MFGTPSRTKVLKEDGFKLPLTAPVQLNVQMSVFDGKLVPTLEYQSAFTELRQLVLSELPKNKQMFKTVPTYASLDSITPPWGFISTSDGVVLSPYLQITSTLASEFEGKATFTLKDILISRSFVVPHFQVDCVQAGLDLDLDLSEELAEVSDIPNEEGSSELRLIDPAVRDRQKQVEKHQIRELFRRAHDAADEWLEKYQPSESESTFSEWAGEEDESETHP